MDRDLPIFMDEVPTYEVRADHMHIRYRALEIVLPVSIMQIGIVRAQIAIDDWRSKHGKVLPIKRSRARH